MFQSAKKSIGAPRTKADFKLEFHATRVPQRGWDKLQVLLILLETGRITVKSGKALVRNGVCQWTDPVYESAKVSFDSKAKEGIYKLVVSTGSSRFGVLGETIINFTEYLGASVPQSLPLPLQNCNTGTILHVKIQCLTPKVLSRDLEEQRRTSPELSLQPVEAKKYADIGTNLSVDYNQGSDHKSSFSRSKEKDTYLSSTFRYSLESLDPPSTPGGSETNGSCSSFRSGDLVSLTDSVSSFAGKQESSSGVSDFIGITMMEGNLDATGIDSKSPNPVSSSYPCKYSHISSTAEIEPLDTEIPKLISEENLSQSLDPENKVSRSHVVIHKNNSVAADFVAETIIEDLHRDEVSWEENAMKLNAEMSILTQQLAAETKRAIEMEIHFSSIISERDSLKAEVELLKSMIRDSESRESGRDKKDVEFEEAMIKIKMLEDKLAGEKIMNHNLYAELQKNQESNLEMLLKIRNLEDSLQKKNFETNEAHPQTCFQEGRNDNNKMEDDKLSWTQKFEENEKKIQKIGKKLVFLEMSNVKGETHSDNESQRKITDMLREELDEVERDLQELTEENIDLMSQLKQANNKSDEKDQVIAHLASEIKILSEQCITPFSTEAELRCMVIDLKEKLRLTEECSQNQLATTRTLLDDLNSSVTVLRSKNALLEVELKSSQENFSSLMNEFNIMKRETEIHDKENALIASQKGQLRVLRERAAKAESEHLNALKQVTSLENLNATMKEEMEQVIIALEHELKASNEKASLAHNRYENVVNMITDLETKKENIDRHLSNFLLKQGEHEAAIGEFKQLNEAAQERLQLVESECANISHQVQAWEIDIKKTAEQFSANNTQISKLKDKMLQLEKTNEELQIVAESKEEQLRISKSHTNDLEIELVALKQDLQASKESRMMSLMTSQNLQEHNDALQNKLMEAEEKITMIIEKNSFVVEELRITNTCMENKLSDLGGENELLKTQKEDLRVENCHLEGLFNEVNETYKRLLEENDILKRNNIGEKDQEGEISHLALVNAQQHEIYELQDKLEAAVKELETNREANHSLQMCIESMKEELTLKTVSYSELDEKFQKLADDFSVSVCRVGMLEDQLAMLNKENQEENNGADFCSAGEYFEERTCKEERNSSWEKAYATEQLQQDVRKHVQQDSSCGYQEELRDFEFAGEKEERSVNDETTLQIPHGDSLSAEDAELINIKMNLAETLEKLDCCQRRELNYQQKVEDLEKRCAILEENRCKLAEEINESRCKTWDSENFQVELRSYMDALQVLKLEKVKTETTLEKISLDNAKLKEEIATLKEKAVSNEDAFGRFKQFRATVEQKSELMRLRRQVSEFKHKASEQMEGREELEKKISSLEEELQRKTCALSVAQKKLKEKEKEESTKPSNASSPASLIARSMSRSSSKVGPISNFSSRDTKEIVDLREKMKVLEGELKSRSLEMEHSRQQFKEKERVLQSRVEQLELIRKQSIKEHSYSNIDQLQKEVGRLKDENASLLQRENELVFRLGSQQALQNELRTLQEENKELRNSASKFNGTPDGDNACKRFVTLETELAEALEVNKMYKSQLQSAFAKQQLVHVAALENLGSAEQVIKDLAVLKRNNSVLEEELREMRERYFRMSIQFAEVEAEREELVMAMRNLRIGRRLTSCKSC